MRQTVGLINPTHAVLVEITNPEQEIGTATMAALLGYVTEGYEWTHIVANAECNLPYWQGVGSVGIVGNLPAQRPFPDPNATLEEGRVNPGAGRQYLQMIRRLYQ